MCNYQCRLRQCKVYRVPHRSGHFLMLVPGTFKTPESVKLPSYLFIYLLICYC